MAEIDIMLNWLNEFQAENKKIKFKDDDVRKNFLDFLWDIGNNYYLSYMMNDFTYLLKEKIMGCDKSHQEAYQKHFKKALLLQEETIINQSYYNSLNRNFLLSTWMSFEVSITTFCDALCTDDEKTKLYKWKYLDIEKKLNNYSISDSDKEYIEKKVYERHLSHVPVDRKIRVLKDKCKSYNRDWDRDLEFLKFFGEYRNTSHSNFIYFKEKGFTYSFNDNASFTFEFGKTVKIDSKYEISPQLFFDILTEFKNIWMELITHINHPEDIPYPIKEL